MYVINHVHLPSEDLLLNLTRVLTNVAVVQEDSANTAIDIRLHEYTRKMITLCNWFGYLQFI